MRLILLLVLLSLYSCSNSNHVVSNSGIQKRKYTRGWFVNRNVHNINSSSIRSVDSENESACDTILFVNGTKGLYERIKMGNLLIEGKKCGTNDKEKFKKEEVFGIHYANGTKWKNSEKTGYSSHTSACDTIILLDNSVIVGKIINEGVTTFDLQQPCGDSIGTRSFEMRHVKFKKVKTIIYGDKEDRVVEVNSENSTENKLAKASLIVAIFTIIPPFIAILVSAIMALVALKQINQAPPGTYTNKRHALASLIITLALIALVGLIIGIFAFDWGKELLIISAICLLLVIALIIVVAKNMKKRV